MVPAPSSTHYQLDSITCIVQAALVILQDFVLLYIPPPAAALKPPKGNALV